MLNLGDLRFYFTRNVEYFPLSVGATLILIGDFLFSIGDYDCMVICILLI